jgi:hypothetical protein
MADYITTDTDITASGLITANDKARLTPAEWVGGSEAAGEWHYWHVEAWSETKRQLANRPDSIAESDLSDSTELKPATLRYVFYLAYMRGRDLDMANEHRRRYLDALNSIQPTLTTGSSAPIWGRAIPMYRG